MRSINYKQLYLDFIEDASMFPNSIKKELKGRVESYGNENLPYKDLVEINRVIQRYSNSTAEGNISKHLNAYDIDYIRYIMNYQKKNKLSNIDISKKFKLSRNTISKWNKLFK